MYLEYFFVKPKFVRFLFSKDENFIRALEAAKEEF